MIFIYGAAYQGMEDYAREAFGARDIRTVGEDGTIDFSTGAVNGLEKFVLACVRRGESAVEQFEALRDQWSECTLIGTDFSCGLVPMEAEARAWREENGRFNTFLAKQSERTIRMFCGIGQELK